MFNSVTDLLKTNLMQSAILLGVRATDRRPLALPIRGATNSLLSVRALKVWAEDDT
jgi:hypothetical protein